jgi:pyruvate kinase
VTALRHHLKSIKTSTQVAVLLDLNGSKPRIGKIGGQGYICLQEGSQLIFNLNDPDFIGHEKEVYADISLEHVSIGDKIYVDDGRISFTVLEVLRDEKKIVTMVDNEGKLPYCTGIIEPHRKVDHPGLIEKDVQDVRFAIQMEADFITLSCIHSEHEVMEVRKILGNSRIKILSKIESKDGLDSFDKILRVSDGIIIDRGYLGVQIDITKLALIQKDIIQRCQYVGKPIWLANQILESMVHSPKPNRSEASDITSGVVDGCDGFILSTETAIGTYPAECLYWARKICFEAERHIDYSEVQLSLMRRIAKPLPVSESIACSAVKCAREVGATCIFVVTESGLTGRLLSKYKPSIPVVVTTTNLMTARQLNASFGLISYFHPDNITEEEVCLRKATLFALELGLVQLGDHVVIVSGGGILETNANGSMRVLTLH